MNAIPFDFSDIGLNSALIRDYLEDDARLAEFHNGLPTQANLEAQAARKVEDYSEKHRSVLVEVLQEQYSSMTSHPAVQENIDKLADHNTVTLCTGHQLSLMTGPLYFIYKILTVLKLAEELNAHSGPATYVPVFWMASEDHDFEEIASFQYAGKKFQWNSKSAGAVGQKELTDLLPVLDLWEKQLPQSPFSNTIHKWLEESYRSATTLSEATFRLVHALFQDYGLLIINADNPRLKALFVPQMQTELLLGNCATAVNEQSQKIKSNYNKNYKPQVNPRPINLFYLSSNYRQRILPLEEGYGLEGNSKTYTEDEILALLENSPERFSPNVLMRPLYQECILPNVAYIGGGGELAYWLQLKSYFQASKIPFPLLLLRQSVLLFGKKEHVKWQKMGLELNDIFLDRNALINKKIRLISNINLDLNDLKDQLSEQFSALEPLVSQTDPSFEGALKAQRQKQLKGLEALEKRLLKAQKRKLKDHVTRLVLLHEAFFPQGKLQERTLNFMEFYEKEGPELLRFLYQNFTPLVPRFWAVELS